MKTLHWGVIGTGDVMEVKSGPGLYKSEGSKLHAVYNRNLPKAQSYAERHNVEYVCESAEELINREDIDIVYIATPPSSHKSYALQVIEAGKIPYIEKPVAMNYAEARDIQIAAAKKSLPVYIAFYRRGLEKFLTIKQLLDEQTIGDIRYINIEQTSPITSAYQDKNQLPWRVRPEISGGGIFMDIGTHVLDCLMLYFGEYDSIQGHAINQGGFYDAEDTVVANFRFKNGVVGSGNWCFVADGYKNQVEIVGSEGRIVYDGMSATEFSLIKGDETTHYQFEQPQHIAMQYQQMVINEVLGKGQSFANFDHAVNLMEKIEGLLAGYYRK